jgi:hypothetical protein
MSREWKNNPNSPAWNISFGWYSFQDDEIITILQASTSFLYKQKQTNSLAFKI